MNDPEAQRVNELLDRAALGQASTAERTELALYTEEHPDLASEAARRAEQARLGAGWIERLDADAKIARVEQSRLTKIEQGMGIALTFGGAGLAFVSPILGSLVIFLGLALTIWSVIRVRLGTYKDDPYRKVKR
ncbi:MAG: hypothetical protein ACPG4T_06770 [Nannocystaceae bacterium]